MAVFDEAAEARRGAAAAAEGAPGEPSKKRNRKEEAHMYRDTIGIGNVGKKGGADTRGGLTVKTVELCNYIYHAGGWEGVRLACGAGAVRSSRVDPTVCAAPMQPKAPQRASARASRVPGLLSRR